MKYLIDFTKRHSYVNWGVADQIIISGSNFAIGLLLARVLGISEFGRFALAWMVVLFFQGIQHAAINVPMLSIGPKQKAGNRSAYFGAVFAQQVVFAIISSILIFVCVAYSDLFFPVWGISNLAFPLAAACFFSQIQDFLRRYHFTIETPSKSLINSSVRYIGQIGVLLILFMVPQFSLTSSTVVWVMAGTSFIAILSVSFRPPDITWCKNTFRKVLSQHWQLSKWLSLSAVMQWTTKSLFIIVAGILLGTTAVGAIRAAESLIGILNILFFGLESVITIRAAKLYSERGIHVIKPYLSKIISFIFVLTVVFSIFVQLSSNFWMGFFYGDAYSQYGYVLAWYSVIYVLFGLGILTGAGLRALEYVKPIFTAKLISSIFAILACYPLIHFMGLTGVLVGMLISQIIERFFLGRALLQRINTE